MIEKQAQIDYYEGLLASHGENYKALDWNSVASQRLRFGVLKEIFIYGKKAADIKILDVGCGFGDFYGYLEADGTLKRNKISYTGYDISPKILEVARKKFPAAKFELKDILEEKQLPQSDYVFCSGALNIKTTATEEHKSFVREFVTRMYDLASCGVAVNFLGEGARPFSRQAEVDSGRYCFFNPEEVLHDLRKICGRFILRHDYHAGDFTVYLIK